MTPLLISVWLALAMHTSVAAASEAAVRELPYPFEHMISFASDADGTQPWYLAGLHRVLNEELGLPVSDSLWPDGSNHFKASDVGINPDWVDNDFLFRTLTRRNDAASGVGTHTVFGMLLRQWHRGNVDFFHGWSLDYTLQLREEFDVPLVGGRAEIQLTPLSETTRTAALFRRPYDNFRIYFSGRIPPDLVITLKDGASHMAAASAIAAEDGRAVQSDQSNPVAIIELLLAPGAESGMQIDSGFDSTDVTIVTLFAASCQKDCDLRVKRIERDNWSRRSALLQAEQLEGLGIRPNFVTDHGGYTAALSHGGMTRNLNFNVRDKIIVQSVKPAALDPASHSYHLDILKRLGLIAFVPSALHDGTFPTYASTSPFVMRPFPGLDIFELNRNVSAPRSFETEAEFIDRVRELYPQLDPEHIRPFFCTGNYLCHDMGQGQFAGLLIAAGLLAIPKGQPIRHLWYMHLGTDTIIPRSIPQRIAPVSEQNLRWWRRLAEHMYNFRGSTPPEHRVWVPAVSTLVRYMVTRREIETHVSVDDATSTVVIAPWTNAVTGRLVPEPGSGTRDLNGITIYVPDSAAARVIIDGRETEMFTRNPADRSGRQSITMVGDNAATVMVGRVPLAERGETTIDDGRITAPTTGAKLTVERTGTKTGGTVLRFRPHKLDLWNTSHLQIRYRLRSPPQSHPGVYFTFEMVAGGSIMAGTAGCSPESENGSWRLEEPSLDRWTSELLATTQITWRQGGGSAEATRPSLPIGAVREIRIGLCNAAPETAIDIDRILALRPDGNGVDADGNLLLAGRVTMMDTTPVPFAQMELIAEDSTVRRTITDASGYYQFQNVKRGSVVMLLAHTARGACASGFGRRIEMERHEAAADVDITDCQGGR